jgi:hypothetical protein
MFVLGLTHGVFPLVCLSHETEAAWQHGPPDSRWVVVHNYTTLGGDLPESPLRKKARNLQAGATALGLFPCNFQLPEEPHRLAGLTTLLAEKVNHVV